jgi:hypothetical protein
MLSIYLFHVKRCHGGRLLPVKAASQSKAQAPLRVGRGRTARCAAPQSAWAPPRARGRELHGRRAASRLAPLSARAASSPARISGHSDRRKLSIVAPRRGWRTGHVRELSDRRPIVRSEFVPLSRARAVSLFLWIQTPIAADATTRRSPPAAAVGRKRIREPPSRSLPVSTTLAQSGRARPDKCDR